MLLVDSFRGQTTQCLLPQRCHWCGGATTGEASCEACERRLPWDDAQDGIYWAALHYSPAIAAQVVGLKFQARFAAAHLLGALMAGRLARRPQPLPEVLVPVPLHPRRLRARGYNQALEIARKVAARLCIVVAPQAAWRVRHTEEQTHLDARARRSNLRGAFAVDAVAVRGRHVAVVDDVITTGATSGELARALAAAGARRVEVWAAARAELRAGQVDREAREHRGA